MKNKNNIHILSRAVILDQEHILLCKTMDLTLNFYFLPGGHIEHGESAVIALQRELKEECNADVNIKRFLGCLEYSFEPGHNSICHNHEYNFVFECESSILQLNTEIPQMEKHIKPTWVLLSKINEIDFRPEPLRVLIPEWLNLNMNNSFKSTVI